MITVKSNMLDILQIDTRRGTGRQHIVLSTVRRVCRGAVGDILRFAVRGARMGDVGVDRRYYPASLVLWRGSVRDGAREGLIS